jgi:2-keto-4-pentenoate hydratase/2-oxohepta-3-ene-1,7-dioic acid hydratase in catechol pathway
MKLARVSTDQRPRLSVVVGEDLVLLDVALSSRVADDYAVAVMHADILDRLAELSVTGVASEALPIASTHLLAPVARPGKIVAVGRNYADHVAEEGSSVPQEPLVFAKFASSILGPNGSITWDPNLTQAVDFEAELAVVVGRRAKNVRVEDALDYVFGYTCLNDISARDLQFSDGQWVRGKSLDTFCPIGPWIVTADEIPDPQQLRVTCSISGEVMQSASTADMLFGVAELIARVSRSFTLHPGDVIATGTPPGVGYFRDPKRLLRDGDLVVTEIERIGVLRNPVVLRTEA